LEYRLLLQRKPPPFRSFILSVVTGSSITHTPIEQLVNETPFLVDGTQIGKVMEV
jgi:hypothetical protein